MKKKALIFSLVVISVLGVLLIWVYLSRPAVGTIIQAETRGLADQTVPQVDLIRHDGQAISFIYPSTYVVKEDRQDEPKFFDKVVLYNQEKGLGSTIVVSVASTKVDSYSEISGVLYRRSESTVYKESSLPFLNSRAVVFKKISDVAEIVYFYIENGYPITISIASPYSTAEGDIERDITTLIKSVRLKL